MKKLYIVLLTILLSGGSSGYLMAFEPFGPTEIATLSEAPELDSPVPDLVSAEGPQVVVLTLREGRDLRTIPWDNGSPVRDLREALANDYRINPAEIDLFKEGEPLWDDEELLIPFGEDVPISIFAAPQCAYDFEGLALIIKEFQRSGNWEDEKEAIIDLLEKLDQQNIYGENGWDNGCAHRTLNVLDQQWKDLWRNGRRSSFHDRIVVAAARLKEYLDMRLLDIEQNELAN